MCGLWSLSMLVVIGKRLIRINTVVDCTSNYCDDFGMISTRKPLEVDIVCFIHRIKSTDWQIFDHFFKDVRKDRKILFSRSAAWRQCMRCKYITATESVRATRHFSLLLYLHIYNFAGPESLNDVWVHLWRIIWILNCSSEVLFLGHCCH